MPVVYFTIPPRQGLCVLVFPSIRGPPRRGSWTMTALAENHGRICCEFQYPRYDFQNCDRERSYENPINGKDPTPDSSPIHSPVCA